jgi:hypothetical protein
MPDDRFEQLHQLPGHRRCCHRTPLLYDSQPGDRRRNRNDLTAAVSTGRTMGMPVVVQVVTLGMLGLGDNVSSTATTAVTTAMNESLGGIRVFNIVANVTAIQPVTGTTGIF